MISFRGKLVTDGRTDEWTDGRRQQIYRTNLPRVGGSKKLINISQDNEFGDKKIIWRQALIVHKRRKYFF